MIVAALVVGATPALAADMTAPTNAADMPSYYWDGLYIGANAGAGAITGTTTDYSGYLSPGGMPAQFSQTALGGLVGVTAGYNLQFGQAVLGVEGDLQWTSLKADSTFGIGYMSNSDWDWFGTVRARAGVAFDRGLVYATAGGVFAHSLYDYGPQVPDGDVASDSIEWGLAAGAGVEYALTDHLSAKLEYIDLILPTKHAGNGDFLTPPGEIDFVSGVQIARAGVNFHF